MVNFASLLHYYSGGGVDEGASKTLGLFLLLLFDLLELLLLCWR